MRWNAYVEPEEGDTRYREKFLWLPKTTLNIYTGRQETRWLEKAEWKECYQKEYDFDGSQIGYWKTERWVG